MKRQAIAVVDLDIPDDMGEKTLRTILGKVFTENPHLLNFGITATVSSVKITNHKTG